MPKLMQTLACGAAAALFVAPPAHADPAEHIKPFSDHERLAGLPERLDDVLERFRGSGASVVVIDEGEVYGWFGGYRDPVAQHPVNADTMFYTASVTKTYTAACVLGLAEDGVIDLHRPIESYLPRFDPATNEHEEPIRVRDLLTHRAGISVPGLGILDAYTGDITEDRYYALLSSQGEAAPGPRYDNENLTAAGRVIDAATGRSWKDVFDERLFEPIGMTRTTAYADAAYEDGNTAVPSYWDAEAGTYGHAPRKFDEIMHAAGGLMTSGRDAARWMLFAMGDGTWAGEHVLSERHARDAVSLLAKLDEPTSDGPFRVDGYGYAWEIGEHAGQPIAFHSGGYMGGFAAFFILFPESNSAIAVMNNGMEFGGAVSAAAREWCIEAISGEPVPESEFSRMEQRLAEQGLPPTRFRPSDPPVADLPCAPGCFGTFEHETWGTIAVWSRGDRVAVRFGKLRLQTSVSEGDIRIEGPVGRGARLRYDAERDAYVSQFVPGEETVFSRVGG